MCVSRLWGASSFVPRLGVRWVSTHLICIYVYVLWGNIHVVTGVYIYVHVYSAVHECFGQAGSGGLWDVGGLDLANWLV